MESILKEKIERIESLMDLSKMIDEDANTISKIKNYYRINDIAFRIFHSDRGFMHFRVTKGKEVQEDDILYQPNVISKYIKKNAKVLELGSGQGANIIYLAKKHPDACFYGVDLYHTKLKKAPKNVTIYGHDYSFLPFIESNSIDVVYGIETIVHNTDKRKIFKEVQRILKKDGIFIIYDYSLVKKYNQLKPYEQTAIKIISKGGASALVEPLEDWKKQLTESGFDELSTIDLHKELLPDLKQLERKANHIMKSDKRVKLFMKLFSKTFFNNILLGWLGYDAYLEGIGYYNEWIYKKREK